MNLKSLFKIDRTILLHRKVHNNITHHVLYKRGDKISTLMIGSPLTRHKHHATIIMISLFSKQCSGSSEEKCFLPFIVTTECSCLMRRYLHIKALSRCCKGEKQVIKTIRTNQNKAHLLTVSSCKLDGCGLCDLN